MDPQKTLLKKHYSKNNIKKNNIKKEIPKTKSKAQEEFYELFKKYQITDKSLIDSFIEHRKKLRASVNNIVLKRLNSEALKANITLCEVLEIIITNGWRGFEAGWINQNQFNSNQTKKSKSSNLEKFTNDRGVTWEDL